MSKLRQKWRPIPMNWNYSTNKIRKLFGKYNAGSTKSIQGVCVSKRRTLATKICQKIWKPFTPNCFTIITSRSGIRIFRSFQFAFVVCRHRRKCLKCTFNVTRCVSFLSGSSVLECRMKFAIYLPPQAEDGKCPLLYYLSGLTCTEQNFIQKAGAQRFASQHGFIVVAADTSPR